MHGDKKLYIYNLDKQAIYVTRPVKINHLSTNYT